MRAAMYYGNHKLKIEDIPSKRAPCRTKDEAARRPVCLKHNTFRTTQ